MNSWIVQCNPQIFLGDWFPDEYAKHNLQEPDWWIIYKKHKQKMLDGDEVYIWKAQSEPSRKQKPEYFDWKDSIGITEKICGIIALGKIKGDPIPYFESQEDLNRFKKYRVVESYSFASNKNRITYKIDCIYEKPENIRVRSPLLQELIWEKLGQSSNTELGVFKYKRRGTRSVELKPWEADIIRSLFAAGR